MSRREKYMESMVKDLRSAYYETVSEESGEDGAAAVTEADAGHDAMAALAHARDSARRIGRWRVIDVMTTDVITIDKHMPCKQVARLLAENNLTAAPVVSGGGRVLGMVSEADLLRREERSFGRLSAGLRRRTHRERMQAEALTAAHLMTAPAITIHPDAPLGAAARLMNAHRVRRLPVVGPLGDLIGIVSRRDLLTAFLRPDSEIAAEIADNLAGIAQAESMRVAVSVTDGEVVLIGELPAADLITTAVNIASEVDGVVTVTSRLTENTALRSAN